MKEIIHIKNGLDIEAIYLNTYGSANDEVFTKVFFAQDRIVECDEDNNEIASHDLLSLLQGLPFKQL